MGKKKQLDNEKIMALVHAGKSVEEVAEAMGVSHDTMIDWFSHHLFPGLPPRKHSEFTVRERIEEAKALWGTGLTKTEIAAEMGMSLGGFSEWCKRHGLNIQRRYRGFKGKCEQSTND